jgi:2-iminobutanoate/2-iminopropanoate deaminase
MRSSMIDTDLTRRLRPHCRGRPFPIFATILISSIQLAAVADPVGTVAEKKVIGTPTGRPYSSGIEIGDTVYVSGQVGYDSTSKTIPEDFAVEVAHCLENVRTVLQGAGLDFVDVVSVQIYLTDIKQYDALNSLYATAFKEPYPTRTTVGVASLPLGAHIEITVTARKRFQRSK